MINRHTCIKDDGGTPNRRCYACDEEKQQMRSKLKDYPLPGLKTAQALKTMEEWDIWLDNPKFQDDLLALIQAVEADLSVYYENGYGHGV